MGCVLKIRTIDYKSASNEGGYSYVQSPNETIIDNDVQKSDSFSIEEVAHMIMRLPQGTRKLLQDKLLSAIPQSYIEKEIREQRLVSNVTITDLFSRFPQYKKDYWDIVKDQDIDSEYTMILCNKMEFAGDKYYGRYIDPDNKPVVIMNNQFGVEKFLKYLATKSIINSKVNSGENLIKDDLRDHFNAIKSHYGIENDEALIFKYLDDKSSLSTFTVKGANGKNITISTQKVLEDVVSDLNEEERSNKSGFYLSLKDAATSTDKNKEGIYQWEMTVPAVEKVVKLYFQDYLQENGIGSFKELSNDKIKEIVEEVFSRDVKLMQAEIQEISEGKSKMVQTQETTKKVSKLADIWKEIQAENGGLKAYKTEFDKDSGKVKSLLQKYFDSHPDQYPNKVTVRFDTTAKGNSTLVAEYIAPAETKEETGSRKIIFTFPYKTLGKYHDYGYDKEYIWLPVPKSSNKADLASKLDANGRYKGCYIYQYFNPKTAATEFVVSRNIITPESDGFIYSSLKNAMNSIDKHNAEDSINSNSLYGINMNKSLRSLFILNSKVRMGQTISVIDVSIPNSQPKDFFHNSLLSLFYGNLSDVKEFFSSNKSVQSLNTPQEAAIFLYKFQQALKDNYKKDAEAVSTKAERTKLEEELQQLRKEYKEKTKDLKDDKKKKELQGKFEAKRDEINQKIKALKDKQDIAMQRINYANKSIQELVVSNRETIDSIVQEIKAAPVKHYFVERVSTSNDVPNAQGLVLREIPETDIDLEFNQLTRKPNIADLENAAKFFKNKYGVNVIVQSKEDLEEFKKEKKVNVRSDARAFVYNGDVYLNGATADLSDMFHEISHIFLRVLRNKKPKAYQAFINKVIKDHESEFYGRRKGINTRYAGFSEDDKVEENVVAIMASNMFRRGNLLKGFQDKDYDKVFSNLLSQIMSEYEELVVRNAGNEIEFDSSVRNILKNAKVKEGLLESARVSNFIKENLGKKIIETDCI